MMSTEEFKPFEPWNTSGPAPEPAPEPERAEPAPQPEPVSAAPEPQSEPNQRPQPENMVPYSRFSEVVQKWRSTEQELERFRAEKQAKLAEPEKKIDPDLDPDAYFKHEIETLRQEVTPLKQELEQRRQQEAYARQVAEYTQWHQSQVQEYSKQAPDVTDAYKHIVDTLNTQLGFAIPNPYERNQYITQWEYGVVNQAISQGKNPAQHIYEIAKQIGYVPKQQAQKPEQELPRPRTQTLGNSAPVVKQDEDEAQGFGDFIRKLHKEAGYTR